MKSAYHAADNCMFPDNHSRVSHAFLVGVHYVQLVA